MGYGEMIMARKVVLVDVDGTIADNSGRSPFDWARVGEDTPIQPIIDVVRALRSSGFRIIFVTGRMDVCREATYAWLHEHVFEAARPYLLMRRSGDFRADEIVKAEIYEDDIKPSFEVHMVIDDRRAVVEMWRGKGLTCLQVAPGDF